MNIFRTLALIDQADRGVARLSWRGWNKRPWHRAWRGLVSKLGTVGLPGCDHETPGRLNIPDHPMAAQSGDRLRHGGLW